MSIDTFISDYEMTITVAGRFDFSLSKEFRGVIDQIDNSVKSIKFDFRKTEYLDSSALGMLLMAKDKIDGGKHNMSIVNVNPATRKILDISKFGQLFQIS